MQNSTSKHTDRYTDSQANIDMKRLARVLWSRWYWILASTLLALLACFIFLKVSKPRYVASVTLRYNEKKTDLDKINQIVQPDFNNQEYLTEKYVIESEEVINATILKFERPFTFLKKNAFRNEDVYPFQPFTAKIISTDANTYGNGTFELKPDGMIGYVSEDGTEEKTFDIDKDTLISVSGLTFKIRSVERNSENYIFTFNDLNSVKKAVDDKIEVKEAEKNLPILEISFTNYNRKYTQDFLEKLIVAYQEYNLKQKEASSDKTITFINDQIKIYSGLLNQASSNLANFKQRNDVPSLQTSMTEVMTKMTDLETQKNTIEIQRSYINLLENSLSNKFETINIGNVGLDATSDGVLVKLVGEMNAAISRRNVAIVKGYSINSVDVKAIDDDIERIRTQILGSVNIQKQKNESTLRIVNQNLGLLQGRVGGLPNVEKQIIFLQSDRDVKEKINLLLINKQIEASITKAGIIPSFDVLTQTGAYKTYPQGLRVLLICLFIGLGIGLGSIFLVRFLNNKFTDISKIGQNEKVNLLGIINRYPDEVLNNQTDITNFLDNRSLFSESVNGIRTNLSFLAGEASEKGKLIVITSEISGEGKSFVTVNLAISLTKTGKKVLVVVSDLRRSKLHKFFDNNNKIGLSNFLAGKIDSLQKAIHHSVIPNLDFIPAGPVPLNPSELIQNPVFENMLEDCRKIYDYVIVDTAPVGLVSDNVPLLRKSDLVVFIIRWMYSARESYMFPDQLAEEHDIKAIGVIINDFYKDDLYASLAPASYYASKGYGYYKYNYDYYGKANNYYSDQLPEESFLKKLNLKQLLAKWKK